MDRSLPAVVTDLPKWSEWWTPSEQRKAMVGASSKTYRDAGFQPQALCSASSPTQFLLWPKLFPEATALPRLLHKGCGRCFSRRFTWAFGWSSAWSCWFSTLKFPPELQLSEAQSPDEPFISFGTVRVGKNQEWDSISALCSPGWTPLSHWLG